MITSAKEFLDLMRSEDPDDYQRFRYDEAPIEIWREVITDYPLASEWVVRNKTSPVEILRELAKDTRSLVRGEVAMTRRITEDIQELLAYDSNYSVRHTLANNSKVADRILSILSQDSDEFVRNAANQRIKQQAEQDGARRQLAAPEPDFQTIKTT